jgi:dTDP-4-amino-4,6-dideoxygalactose transaminase
MSKATITSEGCPYTCPHYKGNVEYSPDMCPNTLELLSQTVALDIPAQMTEEDCDQIAKGIRKVAEAIL